MIGCLSQGPNPAQTYHHPLPLPPALSAVCVDYRKSMLARGSRCTMSLLMGSGTDYGWWWWWWWWWRIGDTSLLLEVSALWSNPLPPYLRELRPNSAQTYHHPLPRTCQPAPTSYGPTWSWEVGVGLGCGGECGVGRLEGPVPITITRQLKHTKEVIDH